MNLSNQELHEFFTELQGLVKAGVPLGGDFGLRGLGASRRVRHLWNEVRDSVQQGVSLSKSLEGRSPQITTATLALIRAGEESGDLLGTLSVVAQAHRRSLSLERCLRLAAFYPTVIVLFLVSVLLFFGSVIVPAFEQLRGPARAVRPSVPEPTMMLTFDLCLWMVTPTGLVATGAFVLLLLWLLVGGLWMRPWMHRHVFAWMPVVGQLVNLGAVTRWAHTLGHLLHRRVNLDTALLLAEQSLDLPRMERESARVRAQVARGEPLAMALFASELIAKPSAGLLVHAEKRGDVDVTLRRLADHWQDRLEYQTQKFQAWFEPLLILFTGLLVVGLAISLYLPILGIFGRWVGY